MPLSVQLVNSFTFSISLVPQSRPPSPSRLPSSLSSSSLIAPLLFHLSLLFLPPLFLILPSLLPPLPPFLLPSPSLPLLLSLSLQVGPPSAYSMGGFADAADATADAEAAAAEEEEERRREVEARENANRNSRAASLAPPDEDEDDGGETMGAQSPTPSGRSGRSTRSRATTIPGTNCFAINVPNRTLCS